MLLWDNTLVIPRSPFISASLGNIAMNLLEVLTEGFPATTLIWSFFCGTYFENPLPPEETMLRPLRFLYILLKNWSVLFGLPPLMQYPNICYQNKPIDISSILPKNLLGQICNLLSYHVALQAATLPALLDTSTQTQCHMSGCNLVFCCDFSCVLLSRKPFQT